jgi:hypothetical protein
MVHPCLGHLAAGAVVNAYKKDFQLFHGTSPWLLPFVILLIYHDPSFVWR